MRYILKLISLFLVFFVFDVYADDKQITFQANFHYPYFPDGLYYKSVIISNTGQVFDCSFVGGSEIPNENDKFIFLKFDDYRCHDGLFHATSLDESGQLSNKEFVFNAPIFSRHPLISFLQNHVWIMDWEKINQLREMTVFEFTSPFPKTLIASNEYGTFEIHVKWIDSDIAARLHGRKGRFVDASSLHMDGDYPTLFFVVNNIFEHSVEFSDYLNQVIMELEIELGGRQIGSQLNEVILVLGSYNQHVFPTKNV